MAPSKSIASIGFELPGGLATCVALSSKTSLLDYDAILFRPDISKYTVGDEHEGRTAVTDRYSTVLREAADHWSRELVSALEAGKTVVVFLPPVESVWVATGTRDYSGTGKNRRTIRHVGPFDNYALIPFPVKPVSAEGHVMRLTSTGSLLAHFWESVGADCHYKVLIEGPVTQPLLVTKSAEKVVGALVRTKGSDGTLLLLPDLDFERRSFTTTNKDGELVWSREGSAFGGRVREAVLRIDAELRGRAATTPPPDWADAEEFSLPQETVLRSRLLEVDARVADLRAEQQALREGLVSEGVLRGLLYEQGTPLEIAIRQALDLLGFKTSSYRDPESEFDVVFECDEGRFLGEAEGRDSKPIGIDKLRQLQMNIMEDFRRDDVSEMACGILFGNGARLKPLGDRPSTFTDKVCSAAKSSGVILVRTPDLFWVARYLSGANDPAFAKRCREALFASKGRVVAFPAPPEIPEGDVSTESRTTPPRS